MKRRSGLSAAAFALSALSSFGARAQTSVQPGAQPGDKPDAIVCQLLANCADPASTATPTDDTPHGKPRVSATRGFSLARPKSTMPVAAAAPSPSMPASHSAATAMAMPRAKPKTHAAHGQYDLNVAFVTGSAEVNPVSRDRVSAFATALQDPRLAGHRVRIEGHTDSTGSSVRNQDLSERRAKAIADMLQAAGIETSRLDVRGFGSSQPLPGMSPRDGANRRVVAVLVK